MHQMQIYTPTIISIGIAAMACQPTLQSFVTPSRRCSMPQSSHAHFSTINKKNIRYTSNTRINQPFKQSRNSSKM